MKIAIIGGGAAGLVCAIECLRKAEKKGERVKLTVFEKRERVGKKILATGNGRCNMMNLSDSFGYLGNKEFVGYALKNYSPQSNLDFFASLGLYTRTDEEGRVYPLSNQASSVLDALRFECERLGAELCCESEIVSVKKKGNAFVLNGSMTFDKVVLALGSKASVKGFNGYDILKNLGIRVVTPKPSLTKLTVEEKSAVKQLKGIRHKAELTLLADGRAVASEKGELLFTDYGLSGIAVMQLSAYAARCQTQRLSITVDCVPTFSLSQLGEALEKIILRSPSGKAENLLTGFMPKKLGEVIVKNAGLSPADTLGSMDGGAVKAITSLSKRLTFTVTGVTGFEEAQVVSGGADTAQFNPKTMECLRIRGLYCVGELLDVDGLCGGYNLGWAWSSGRLCGSVLV